ncbi:phage holin family protein [Streptomyces sp. NPDC002790]|uniref:phage holin family protein n=1 Tax=Streptomyces sp. NPDC002790 TaxID=3154431 RepID=UPI0033204E97
MQSSGDRTAFARGEAPVSELVQQASRQLTELMRSEMRLARMETAEKAKRFGFGGGMFGGAGLVGFLACQALVATAVAALALAVPLWVSGLVITGVLLIIAAVMAALGRKQLRRATPPAPRQTIESVTADIDEIRERAHR